MELVSSIKQSSRGKGKGFAWQVELRTPGVYGNIDSQIYGAIAVSEIIDTIRRNWRSGRRVDGRAGPMRSETRLLRKAQKFVIQQDPEYSDYMRYITTQVDRYVGWKARLANNRRRRLLYIREAKFDEWKNDVYKRHLMDVPSGEIGKKRTTRRYMPDPDGPAIDASGLMVDGVRGKLRNARTARIGGRSVVIRQHVELRVPKSRQRAAAWVGGLTQGDTDGITRTFAHMPLTGAFVRDAVRWQNLEKRATNFFAILRLLRLAARVMT